MQIRAMAFCVALSALLGATRAEPLGHPSLALYSGTETGVYGTTADVTQDEEGRLYFAGRSLLVFDGDRWEKTAIPETHGIHHLRFGRDGKLWAAAIGDLGWFEQNPDRAWEFHSLLDRLPPAERPIGEVMSVFAEEEGATFVTADRILRWDGSRFRAWSLPGAGKISSARTADAFYLHRPNAGLYVMENSGPRLIGPPDLTGDAAALWVERSETGWLLGTSNGFFAYDGHALTPFAPDIVEFLQKSRIACACRLPDGRIAVGTVRAGIVFLYPDGRVERFIGAAEGLPSLAVYSLFVDRDHALWAGTTSHIVRIDIRQRSTLFDARAGLPPQGFYWGIAQRGDVLSVVGENGVYELDRASSRFLPVDTDRGGWQDIRGTDHDLILSGFKGAKRWDGRRISTLIDAPDGFFVSLASPRDGGVTLFGVNRSVVAMDAAGATRILVSNTDDNVISLAEDPAGGLWMGTGAHGLWFAKPAADTTVAPTRADGNSGLPKLVRITRVRAAADGTILVFADNGAWEKPADAPAFRAIRDFPARPIAAVSQIAPDGSLWVAHQSTDEFAAGVGRISVRDGARRWEPHAVDLLAEIGAPRGIFVEAKPAGESVLWIGGTRSLLRTEVGATLAAPPPRPPLLAAFARAGGSGHRQLIQRPLAYATHSIELEFAAPEFSHRPLLRIQNRIDGIDDDWVNVDASSRRELTAIRDGRYTVHARVVAQTGAVSDEARVSFQVLPPWWRTLPALVGFGLALAPLAYGVHRLRVRTLRRRYAVLEHKVRVRTEELEAASAAKTQFVANMSHDIRNPLNGIVGLVLALEDTPLDAKQHEMVATLRECTTYLSSLVDDVLDFASIEAGQVELRPGPFVPEELLRSLLTTLKTDATERGATLRMVTDPLLPPTLLGDAGRIQQILVNFISNALKYAGGEITVTASLPANSPGEIEFAVADRGPGIDLASQTALFTKFSRVKQTLGGEEIPGSGLGLAACRLLADIMGGSVGVQSGAGLGARFFLRLPLTVAVAPVELPSSALPNTTVLLVEDTDYNAWAAAAVLARLGLVCERVRTGAEALRLFGEKRFNVVLLDRNLPDMDGTDVARRMRALESGGPPAVLLAVTAYCTAEDRALCLDAGMDAFVGKPLTPEKLRKVLLAAGRRLLASASVQAQVPDELLAGELDLGLLTYLSDGSPPALVAQIERFLATLGEVERALEVAAKTRDLSRIAAAAHQVVGQARMVGAARLLAAAEHLQAAARRGERERSREELPRVRAEIAALTAALRHRQPIEQSA